MEGLKNFNYHIPTAETNIGNSLDSWQPSWSNNNINPREEIS